MKLGELDIKKAYFGTKQLKQNNAYIGIIPIIKDEEIPNDEIWYTSTDGNIVTPNSIEALPIIISNKYNNRKGVIKFKTNITDIGETAFANCNSLSSIIIPNNVTNIGARAFYNCSNLTSITIGNSVINVEEYAFLNCAKLIDVYINNISAWCNITFNSFTSNPLIYAKHLYVNNIEVINLIIPEDVTNIGKYAFYNWTNLASVIIGNSVTGIGNEAFTNCTGLTSIIIPNSVTDIKTYAFGQIQAKILFSKLYSTYTNKIFTDPTTNVTYNIEFNIFEIPTGYNISSMLPQITANEKNTIIYNIYTDYAPCKDQALALATTKTIVNVYHIDGTPWE